MLGSNEISNQEIDSTDKIGGGIGSAHENTSNSKKGESDISAAHILIKDSNNKNSDPALHSERGLQGNEEAKNKVINYETFESSSEDEFSQGAFESAANSFQNKEKNENNLSDIQEHKRQERQRRKERKYNEKVRVKAEQERAKRKNIRKRFRLQS